MTNEAKAKEFETFINALKEPRPAYTAAIEMAEWKDFNNQQDKKDILRLVNLIPCNEGNESVINDIKKLLQ